ncbi:MAG: DUF1178 family protein [Xanthobacteraceae bacterium]|nr:DUF1178 family protein [Xanthobacteraceae bacterium]
MIRYSLACEAGHGFDSWFRSSADYDEQRAQALIACPVCASTAIEKRIMAPSLARADKESVHEDKTPVAMMSPEEKEFRKKLRELREHVTKNADYVGDRFPQLARQMHEEEIEKRSIYGEAKPAEVRALLEEGVEVQPLPILPEERN